jgi:hypothetical protein
VARLVLVRSLKHSWLGIQRRKRRALVPRLTLANLTTHLSYLKRNPQYPEGGREVGTLTLCADLSGCSMPRATKSSRPPPLTPLSFLVGPWGAKLALDVIDEEFGAAVKVRGVSKRVGIRSRTLGKQLLQGVTGCIEPLQN